VAELVVALDLRRAREALALVDGLGRAADWYKIGSALYVSDGPAMVRELRDRGKRVFLDLKWHDIPSTVARAVVSAAEAGVALATVHLTGGPRMLEAAAAARSGGLKLAGVGVLTSLGAEEYGGVVGRRVTDVAAEQCRLVCLGVAAGLDGYVAAAGEARAVRDAAGGRALIVVTGVRRARQDVADQARAATPREAAQAGADLVVVGRPITSAPDPGREAMAILEELKP
jgi:orotidine-5'-phosphate decarboxylase